MKRDTKSKLIKLAAEMVLNVGMPDMEFIDEQLPRSSSRKLRRELLSVVTMAQRQATRWGREVSLAVSGDAE